MNQRAGATPLRPLQAEAFIRGECTLTVIAEKPFDEVAASLENSLAENDLHIIHVLDFNRLLGARDLRLGVRCRVYEVLEPRLAAQLIALEPDLAHLLPCRIAMHDDGGVTTVTTPMPTTVMTEFSHSVTVARLARSLEARLQQVLTGLRAGLLPVASASAASKEYA